MKCMSRSLATVGAVATLALASLAGCASPEAPPVAEALAQAPRVKQPSSFRLAVAPLEVAPEAALGPVNADDFWSPVPVDSKDLTDALVAAITRSGVFGVHDVDVLSLRRGEASAATSSAVAALELPVGAAAGGAATSPASAAARTPLFRVPREVPLSAVFAEAANRRDELVLSFRVKKHAVEYAGHNAWYYFNLVNFCTWIWPAWFVADERYAGALEVEAVLRAVGNESELRRFTLTARCVEDLDHLERGWKLAGTFTVPDGLLGFGALNFDNYRTAGEMVLPYARNAVAVSLTAALAAMRPSMDEPAFTERLAQSLAVVVGVGRYGGRVPNMTVASDDAGQVYQLLTDPKRGGVPARNVTWDAFGRAAILGAVKQRAERGKPGDTLYFYFSGYGFASGEECYLAPADFDAGNAIATAISLSDLAKALGSGGARQVVILDTSFVGEPHGKAIRTLAPEILTGVEGAAGGGDQKALERFAAGRLVLLAAEPGSAATELSPKAEDKKSLLVAALIDAILAPATDADKNGTLSLREVFEVAKDKMPRISARAGLAQTPALLGDIAAERDEAKNVNIAKAARK